MIFYCEVNGYKRVTRKAKHQANKGFYELADGFQRGIQYRGGVTLVPSAGRSITRRSTRPATRSRGGAGRARRSPA